MAWRPNGARPPWRGAMALALCLLITAACAAPKVAPRVSEDESPPPSTAAETPGDMAVETAPEPAPSPPAAQQILEPPAAPAPEISAWRTVNDDPEQLMGLASQAVNRLLGPPSLLRTETPAEVWQYRAADCVLDIFLYAEEEQPDRSRVTYYEIRAADSAPSGARACFADIIESRNLAAPATPES